MTIIPAMTLVKLECSNKFDRARNALALKFLLDLFYDN